MLRSQILDSRAVPQSACPFCYRIAADDVEQDHGQVVAFTPLNPVTPGHLLVIPKIHVEAATVDPVITAETMRVASILAAHVGDCNLITSVGLHATQTVYHLHIHIVPRRRGDGLTLPWTGQHRPTQVDTNRNGDAQ